MIKALTKVGRSHALIIPAKMIIKFKLGKKVMIEETENGILIHAVDAKKEEETSFQKKLRELRENPEKWKRELEEFVNDPEVQAYYRYPKNILY